MKASFLIIFVSSHKSFAGSQHLNLGKENREKKKQNTSMLTISSKRGDGGYTGEPISAFAITMAIINHRKTFLR